MTVDAASAVAAGLVDLIAPAGGVDVATAEVIEAIRRGEPEAVAAVKRFPPAGLGRDDAAQLLATLRDRPQFAEGIAAMRGGRLPTWAAPGGAKP
jgi:enoyl-CoA hydratase/carnithine racemase